MQVVKISLKRDRYFNCISTSIIQKLSEGGPTLVFLPGEFHRQGSLAGCSPCGHKE